MGDSGAWEIYWQTCYLISTQQRSRRSRRSKRSRSRRSSRRGNRRYNGRPVIDLPSYLNPAEEPEEHEEKEKEQEKYWQTCCLISTQQRSTWNTWSRGRRRSRRRCIGRPAIDLPSYLSPAEDCC